MSATVEETDGRPFFEEEEAVAMETYYHNFSHQEVLELVVGSLVGKAQSWLSEAKNEDLKGAANQTKIQMLNWGAGQLRALAEVIADIPDGELRERVVSETFDASNADLPTLQEETEAGVKADLEAIVKGEEVKHEEAAQAKDPAPADDSGDVPSGARPRSGERGNQRRRDDAGKGA